MKLLYQTHSPFARKVLVFAHEVGLVDQLEVVHLETSPTRRNDEVFAVNPLGKVPVLIDSDGETIFDSSVICAVLDRYHEGPRLIPDDRQSFVRATRLEALADGLSEAGILVRWETSRRPEAFRYQPYLEGQTKKLREGYHFIEHHIALGDEVTIGEIALATSLSWLEFRDLPSFRSHPKLTTWYDSFSRRHSMQTTHPSGETHD